MTLNDAKVLLERKRIPYRTAQYESEAEYWRHISRFSDLSQAGSCRTMALVIPSVNGAKDIELQFNRVRGEYLFEELWFGAYDFEMSDYDPDLVEADILDIIGQIVDGKLMVIEANDLKTKRWVNYSCFDLTDSDAVFGEPGYREAIEKIEAPKTLWQKLTGRKLQYDIYDWRTHRQIVK